MACNRISSRANLSGSIIAVHVIQEPIQKSIMELHFVANAFAIRSKPGRKEKQFSLHAVSSHLIPIKRKKPHAVSNISRAGRLCYDVGKVSRIES